MRRSVYLITLLLFAILLVRFSVADAVAAQSMSRTQALKALKHSSAKKREAGVNRLSEIGLMADTEALVKALHDENQNIRVLAESALWEVWSRSGDAKIDMLFERGLEEMNTRRAEEAIATFSEIIRLKPEFAEGWNKRATIYYLTGQLKESLADCDEVIKRNPKHFGALSGYGLIYLKLGELEHALDYFQQALAVNPNMNAVARNIEMIKQELAEQGKNAI